MQKLQAGSSVVPLILSEPSAKTPAPRVERALEPSAPALPSEPVRPRVECAGLRAERCRSGRTGRSRKPLCLYGYRGFESLPLRHYPSLLFWPRPVVSLIFARLPQVADGLPACGVSNSLQGCFTGKTLFNGLAVVAPADSALPIPIKPCLTPSARWCRHMSAFRPCCSLSIIGSTNAALSVGMMRQGFALPARAIGRRRVPQALR